jgi:sialic acid synthase SpsE
MAIVKINDRCIGEDYPTYFIADIAANHDGDLDRALLLIDLAKEAGADAVKFQHHDCKKYVSDYGFRSLGSKQSHQTAWKKSIYEVYKDAEVPVTWTQYLYDYCNKVGIDFFSTPYDLEMVDHLDPYVPAFKIGSGDVNWFAMLEKVAATGKPVIFSTGAATIGEVQQALDVLSKLNKDLIMLQCNTNYTGSEENFDYIHLNVLSTYSQMYPNIVIGLSDHTPGDVTVLGSVTLGARVVEKHFTDDTSRPGPDHPFSMDPTTWREMVDRTRLLERALGSTEKFVQSNEEETIVLQRRSIRLIRNVLEGERVSAEDVRFQRPCPIGAFSINSVNEIIGKTFSRDMETGEHIQVSDINFK